MDGNNGVNLTPSTMACFVGTTNSVVCPQSEDNAAVEAADDAADDTEDDASIVDFIISANGRHLVRCDYKMLLHTGKIGGPA